MINCKNADFGELLAREWIVTNGIGGYASSSICCANTRRYHGLLVASFNPPTERMVLVSKVEASVFDGEKDIAFSSNQYQDSVFPEGYRHLRSFCRQPLPQFNFDTEGYGLEKTVFMVYGSNATVVEYRNSGSEKYLLKLNPLFLYRDYHSLWHEQPNFDFQIKKRGKGFALFPFYGATPVFFCSTKGRFVPDRFWNSGLIYRIDKERGQEFTEDVFSTGRFEHELAPGASMHLIFSLDEALLAEDPDELKQKEIKRLAELPPEDIKDQFLRDLIVSGDQFIVQRRTTDNYSVIAGYHWFTDWGRDSMIAIRGLCIATGKKDIAKSVISTFLAYLKQGIIPNRFPDYKGDMAEYNTVDATLWLFIAVHDYDAQFSDMDFLSEIQPQLRDILSNHVNGTFHNIRVAENGLLAGGAPGVALTWMDARIGDQVFTPRQGCPVEVNALWYNALKIYCDVCEKLSLRPEENFCAILSSIEKNFVSCYWNRNGYLYDVVTPERNADLQLRPNQVYALSLPYSPIPEKQAHFILESIRKHLLTPFGLRTLEPNHPDFKSSYAGDLCHRDRAYHQGTVWPFLLPEYLLAYLRLHKHSQVARKQVAVYLQPLKAHFYNSECLHGISEVFDGLHPAEGKGCAQQAWSVSNLILLLIKTGIRV